MGCLVEAYGKGAYGESGGGGPGKKGRYVFTPDIWAKKTRITKYAKPAYRGRENQVNWNDLYALNVPSKIYRPCQIPIG